jgi:hypothetical protein
MVRETRWGIPGHQSIADVLEILTEPPPTSGSSRRMSRLYLARVVTVGRTPSLGSRLCLTFRFSGFSYTPANAGIFLSPLAFPPLCSPAPDHCSPRPLWARGEFRPVAGNYRRIRTSAVPSPCAITDGTTAGNSRVMSAVRCTCTVWLTWSTSMLCTRGWIPCPTR